MQTPTQTPTATPADNNNNYYSPRSQAQQLKINLIFLFLSRRSSFERRAHCLSASRIRISPRFVTVLKKRALQLANPLIIVHIQWMDGLLFVWKCWIRSRISGEFKKLRKWKNASLRFVSASLAAPACVWVYVRIRATCLLCRCVSVARERARSPCWCYLL